MKIDDILVFAAQRSATFRQAMATVLPEECEFHKDNNGNLTDEIRWERPDSHGLTFAGLNQQDDGLPVDSSGNVTATPEWIASTYYQGNTSGSTGYWLPCGCDRLPYPLNILVFCQAVNQGDGVEIKLLQRTLNDYGAHLTIDGKMGQMTLNAAMQHPDSNELALAFLAKSRAHYTDIVDNNPNLSDDLQGWFNRINDLKSKFCTSDDPS